MEKPDFKIEERSTKFSLFSLTSPVVLKIISSQGNNDYQKLSCVLSGKFTLLNDSYHKLCLVSCLTKIRDALIALYQNAS